MKADQQYKATLRSVALCALLLLGTPAWSQLYEIEDLGTLGGNYVEATGINQAGHVCGNARTAAGPIHAFRWLDGELTDLGTLGGLESRAAAYTNTGSVVGSAQTPSGAWRPVIWALEYTRELTLLASADGGAALDMNDFGVIAGLVEHFGDLYPFGILWTPIDARLNPLFYEITAVNAAGHAVGTALSPAWLPVLWRGDEVVDLQQGFPATEFAHTAVDLNGCDQVVVVTTHLVTHRTRTWRWTDGRAVWLGELGPGPTVGEAISDAGAVVGASAGRAFLYTDGEGMVDLNGRLGARTDWVLQKANDLNSAGQIVGYGLHNGQRRAFRLTPVPTRHGRPTAVSTYP
jgi:probable HAF family extracellular repeat protein